MALVALTFFLLLALSANNFTESAKILAVFPFPGPSQYILVQSFLKNLAARGHELTVINAFPQKEKIKNFRDVPVMEVFKNYEDMIVAFVEMFETYKGESAPVLEPYRKWKEMLIFGEFFSNVTKSVLRNENVQQLMKSPNENFDLVITETMSNDALFGLAQHFKAMLIGFSSFGTDPSIDEFVNNVSPLAYVPLVTASFTDHMTFSERLQNFVLTHTEELYGHLVHLPNQAKIYNQYFPDAHVDLYTLRKNFSLVLLNQHFTLSYPRPYVPNMIEVGGLYLFRKATPLPEDMRAFLENSEHGVIYFSMGSNIKSKYMSKEKIDVLMKTFGSLKQNIMWKFEETNFPGKPDNVFISSWFPQPDILSHPKVKLFITHGGLLSTIEALYHGKPVIGIPMVFDQFLNVERAKKAGFGLRVDFGTLSVQELKHAIKEILENPSFTNKAQQISRRYHDQPMSAMETAIFWTEYVLRHDGATHMRVASADLNFVQNNCLDVLAVLFVGFGLLVYLVFLICSKLLSLRKKTFSRRRVKDKYQ